MVSSSTASISSTPAVENVLNQRRDATCATIPDFDLVCTGATDFNFCLGGSEF